MGKWERQAKHEPIGALERRVLAFLLRIIGMIAGQC